MNLYIMHNNPNSVWNLRNIKPKGKFLAEILEKLIAEEKSAYVYGSEDTARCVIFVIPKIDYPSKPRYIHDLVNKNEKTEMQPALISS